MRLIYTIIIAIGFLTVSIQAYANGKDDKEKKEEKDNKEIRNLDAANARPDIPGVFLVDVGVNQFLDAPVSLELGSFGSKIVNLYYYYPMQIGESHFSFYPGLGFGLEKYNWDNDITLVNTSGQTSFVQLSDVFPGAEIKTTKLATNYFDIPLEIRWHLNKYDPRRSFKIAVGGKAGILFDAHTKIKYKLDGENIKLKQKNDFNLNRFRYGVHGRIGIAWFNLFFYYGLNQVFEGDKGPLATEATNYNIGISLSGF